MTTTVDPAKQKQAVDAVAATMNGQPADLRTALVSVDPRSGAIVAYVVDHPTPPTRPGSPPP